mmetsp:Transcript_12854/g.34057  ORF Transcript_12854/g.34057 Transcript_12854/m.34057 type:complete len:455 (+) Transcript_12854:717-2081(+)
MTPGIKRHLLQATQRVLRDLVGRNKVQVADAARHRRDGREAGPHQQGERLPPRRRAQVGVVGLERLLYSCVRRNPGPLQEAPHHIGLDAQRLGDHVADLEQEQRREGPGLPRQLADHQLERRADVEAPIIPIRVVDALAVRIAFLIHAPLLEVRAAVRGIADPRLVLDGLPALAHEVGPKGHDPEEDAIVPRHGHLQRRLAPQRREHAVRRPQDHRHVVEQPVLEVGGHEAPEQLPEDGKISTYPGRPLRPFQTDVLPLHGEDHDEYGVAEPAADLDEAARGRAVCLLAVFAIQRLELGPVHVARFWQRSEFHRDGFAVAVQTPLEPREVIARLLEQDEERVKPFRLVMEFGRPIRLRHLDGIIGSTQGAVRRALGQLQRIEDDDRGAAPRRLLAGVLDELPARRLGPSNGVRRVHGLVLDRVLDEGAAADAPVDALGAALLDLLLLAAVPPSL